MNGLFLELDNLKLDQVLANQTTPNLMELMQPEGFVPDLNLSESVSITGSPLKSASEVGVKPQPLPGDSLPSIEFLSGVSEKLADIANGLTNQNPSISNSTVNTVNNALSVSTDLVKIEPKKVELSIKDVASLEDLITKISTQKETPATEKITPTVTTGTLTTATEQTPTNKPKLDISLFGKTLVEQDRALAANVNATLQSGGDLSELFNTDVIGKNLAEEDELAKTYSKGITTAVDEFKVKAEQDRLAKESAAESNLTSEAINPTLTPVSTPLAPAKEVVAPTFNKEIAKGLTDVAEANSKIVSQTNIVNQTQAAPKVQPTINLTESAPGQSTVPSPSSEYEENQTKGVEVNASDPVLAGYMLQMLNILKSGQLKVKLQ